jgi:anti-sigma B factor antagonist
MLSRPEPGLASSDMQSKTHSEERKKMAKANVTMDVRKISDQVSVIDIRGEVNGFAENTLMDAYTQANAGKTQTIILNFTGLEYMNSSGIGLLVTLLIRANRLKQQLFAYGLNDHYRQIFDLTRLNEAIRVFADEREALAAAEKVLS